MRPQPYAFAAPKPCAMAGSRVAGSRTVRIPSKSTVEYDIAGADPVRRNPVLIVSVHRHVGGGDFESRLCALSMEPGEASFPNDLEASDRPLALRMGTQHIHHHVVLDGTAVRRMTATDDRIGAERKPEPISGFEGRRERLRCIDLEQPVPILWLSRGKDEKLARAGLAPQEVTSPIGAVGEKGPHKVMSRLPGCPASADIAQQQGREGAHRGVASQADTGEIPHRSRLAAFGGDDPLEPLGELPARSARDRIAPSFDAALAGHAWCVVVTGDGAGRRPVDPGAPQDRPFFVAGLSRIEGVHDRSGLDDGGIERQAQRRRLASDVEHEARAPEAFGDPVEIDGAVPARPQRHGEEGI